MLVLYPTTLMNLFLPVIFICVSLMTNDIENLSVYLLAICVSLERYLFKSFSIFYLSYLSFYCWIVRVLIYSVYKTLNILIYMVCKYFFTFSGLFHFLCSDFWCTEVRNFDEVQFICFFFDCAFDIISKKPLPNSRSDLFLCLNL